jgi:hypothetical protein
LFLKKKDTAIYIQEAPPSTQKKKRTKLKGTLDYVRKLVAELEVGTLGRWWCFCRKKEAYMQKRERDIA